MYTSTMPKLWGGHPRISTREPRQCVAYLLYPIFLRSLLKGLWFTNIPYWIMLWCSPIMVLHHILSDIIGYCFYIPWTVAVELIIFLQIQCCELIQAKQPQHLWTVLLHSMYFAHWYYSTVNPSIKYSLLSCVGIRNHRV